MEDIVEFDGKLFTSVLNVGLYQSSDNGSNWTKLDLQVGNMVHFVKHNTELLAIGYGTLARTANGDDWTTGNAPPAFINDVSSDGVTIYAGTRSGVYKSTNAGVDWTPVPVDGSNIVGIGSVVVNGTTVWAAQEDSNVLFHSTDNGSSWTKIQKGTVNSTDLYLRGTDIYVNTPGDGVYKSTDGGANWQAIHTSPYYDAAFFGTSTTLYHIANSTLYTSSDNGVNWTVSNNILPDFTVQCVFPGSSYFFVATLGGGVFRNDLVASSPWLAVNNGFIASTIDDIEVIGNKIFVGEDYLFIRMSADNTVSWTQQRDSHSNVGWVNYIVSSGSDIFAAQQNAGIQWSNDNGTTWQLRNNGLASYYFGGMALTPSALFVANGNSNGVYRSTDKGITWTKKSEGIIATGIRSMYASGKDLYAGTWTGLYWSQNDGDSWTRISGKLPDESISNIAKIESMLFAATQFHGLYRSSNSGTDWEPVLSNFLISSLTVHNNYILAGVSTGQLFISSDLGDNWTDVSIGLPTTAVNTVAFNGETVLAGTLQNGLYTRSMTEFMAPSFTFYSNHHDLLFLPDEKIFVKSDEELRSITGDVLQSSDLVNYISVTNSKGEQMAFEASLSADNKTISIKVAGVIVGDHYFVSLESLRNTAGLSSTAIKSPSFYAVDNFAPVVSSIHASVPENSKITFTNATFSAAYSDEDSDQLQKIKISSVPAHGHLQLNNAAVTVNTEVPGASLNQLAYIPDNGFTGDDQWTWNASDGKNYALIDAPFMITVTPVTGVQEATDDSVQLYPNPVREILYVNFSSKGILNVLTVYDLSGTELKKECFTEEAGKPSVDFSDLPAGVYVLKFQSAKQQSYFRIVKH